MSDFDKFISQIQSIKNEAKLKDFLIGITTAREREELGQRLQIIERLLRAESHHSIAKDLGVGVATVTRGSKELKAGKFIALKEQQ